MLKYTQNKLQFVVLWFVSLCSLWAQSPSINADFQVSSSGALTYNVPIVVPSHTLGIFPNLSLSYNSHGNDGIAGYGWNLAGLSSITRIAATPYYDDLNDPVDFDLNDRFVIDGQRLILESGSYGRAGSTYTTENYSNVKIEAINTSSFGTNYGPAGFIVTQPDGTRYYYGMYNNSRSKLEWSLCRILDTQGNQVDFSYTIQDDTLKLNSINDNEANISVAFTYGTKRNALPIGIGGQFFRNNRLLTAINVTINGINYNSYELEHSTTSANFSRLNKIEQTSLEEGSLPAITFSYPDADNGFEEYSGSFGSQIGNSSASVTRSGDVNGDEISDYLFYNRDREDADYKGILIKQGAKNGNFVSIASIFIDKEFEEAFFVKYTNYLGEVQEKDGVVVISRFENSNKFIFYLYAESSYGLSLVRSIEWLAPIKNPYGKIIASSSYVASANVPELTYQLADFNNDGVTDIMPIVAEGGTYTERTCYEDCSGGGPIDPTDPIARPESELLGPLKELNSVGTNLIFPTDCVTVCENYTGFNWRMFYLISMEQSYNNENNINASVGTGTYADVNYITSDINADGYPDLYYQNGEKLYSRYYNPIHKGFDAGTTVYLENDNPVYAGDFNGDGKLDFVQPKEKNSSNWYFYINNGNGFEIDEQAIGIVYEENKVSNQVYVDSIFGISSVFQYLFLPIDFNKDGKTDIIKHKIVAPADSYTSEYSLQEIDFFENTSRYLSSSNFINFTSKNSITKNNVGKPREGHPMSADVNHINLRNQYAYADFEGTINIYSYSGDHNKEVRLEEINNNALVTTVNYDCLGETNVQLGPGDADANAAFPYNTIVSAKDFKLVSSVHQAAVDVERTKYYRYGNLVTHNKGLGFLGFGSMANTNWTGDNIATIWNVTIYDITKRHALSAIMSTIDTPPRASKVSTAFGSSRVINKTFYEYDYTLHDDKSYTLLANNTENTDVITGVVTNTQITYDSYNNPLTETTTNSDGSTTTILSYFNNPSGTNSNYYIGRPKEKTVTQTLGAESFTTYEKFSYTSNLLKTKQTKANSSNWLTETYTHDGYGNVLSTTLSGSDFADRVTSKTYNSTGRLVKTATDIQNFTSTYNYDEYGRLTSETDPFGKSETFVYDDYHRLIQETDYLGNTITTTYGVSNLGFAYITKNSSLSSLSDSYQSINRLGWETNQWTRNDLGEIVQMDKTYLANGAIKSESTPYITSGSRLWTTYDYDEYNRPFLINRYNGQTVTTTYNGLIVSVDDGTKTVSSTQDAMGNKVSITDPGGTINYKYYANNSPKETTYGTHKITTKIDDWGRKTELNDPAAGIYTYSYNSIGELLLEKSPLGSTTYTYDDYGNQKTKFLNGYQVALFSTYNYNANGQLAEVEADDYINNKNYNYTHTYDTYQRPTKLTEITSLARFDKTITYDAQGRPNIETISSKLNSSTTTTTINLQNKYHSGSGAVIGVTDTATNRTIWEAKAQDAFGNYTSMSLGNGIAKTNAYNNYGLPTSFVHKISSKSGTTTALDYSLSINEQTGNVSNRHNAFFDGEETFKYDNQDRLTDISGATTEKQIYNPDGNIKINPQVGTYNYDPTTKYRVAGIDLNTTGQNYYQNHTPQNIVYNAFKKPVSIHEEGNGRVNFEYGPMMNRAVAYYGGEQTNKNERDYTKVYSAIAPIEIITNNTTGSVKTISYIMGDAYTAPAVHVNEDGNSIYNYLHRDHIGSILAISDSTAKVIEKTHFGAWGTVEKYWDIKGNTTLGYESLLGRGYTGHEHFTSVSLLHMNGRMYDPQLRRFLSPDNFIQDPFNTQSFNRYGYVWNNPLKFNDPSGELFLTAIIIGAVIGAYIGGASANGGELNPLKWEANFSTLAGVLGGAVIGAVGGELVAAGITGGLAFGAFTVKLGVGLAVPGVGYFGITKSGEQLATEYTNPNGETYSQNIGTVPTFGGGNNNNPPDESEDAVEHADDVLSIRIPTISGGIDNTYEATSYYLNGNGGTVSLGQNTVNALLTHDSFLYRHERIVTGQTTALQGNFSVNLTADIFHVGRTNVNYSINCSSGECTATYTLFAGDGYWDFDYIDENTLGRLGVKSETADGPGPNLERFGGVPYYYRPVTVNHKFRNPGYK